jgi:hypothetical protein
MPPNARLYLARASLFTDEKGRTRYSPDAYSADMRDTVQSGNAAVQWLLSQALISLDVNEDGEDCYRLTHYDYDREPVIGGYSRDAGQKRDGAPPQYGRTVADVLDPPSGNLDYRPARSFRDEVARLAPTDSGV